jgi:hypothetical protein
MRWACIVFAFSLWCCKENDVKVEGKKSNLLDSCKYGNLGFAKTYHKDIFLLSVCGYNRYGNCTFESKKYEFGSMYEDMYYEIIDLSSKYKNVKKVGKLYFFRRESHYNLVYHSDTSQNGFYFKCIRQEKIPYKNRINDIIIERVVSSQLDSLCTFPEEYVGVKYCFYGEYKSILNNSYRIITDEEISNPQTKIKNEEFMKSIKN